MAKLIEVKKGDRTLHVTEKVFRVVYSGFGYKKIGEVEEVNEQQPEEKDLFQLDRDELKKVNKDDIKAFLDEENIEYDSKATKEELIAIVLGEE